LDLPIYCEAKEFALNRRRFRGVLMTPDDATGAELHFGSGSAERIGASKYAAAATRRA
jgi:hypothetical protein